jgi:hypothetical protein
MACPHCKSAARARTSTQLSPLFREVTYQCANLFCGHVWVCGLEAIRTLSPSAKPDPEINIPLSPHVQRRVLAQQLNIEFQLETDAS